MHSSRTAAADLHWIPLGAGGHCVRFNGRVFEAIEAARQHRPRRDLYHAALVIELEAIGTRSRSRPRRTRRGAPRRGGHGRRREPPRRLAAPVSLRGPPLARWVHRGPRRGGRQAPPAHQRPSGRPSAPRCRQHSPDARVGARRARDRRDVALELRGRLADRHRKFVDRRPPAATARSRSRWHAGLEVARRSEASSRSEPAERCGELPEREAPLPGAHVLFQWDFVWDFAALRWRVAATCEWAAPDRNCRCAGMSAMARPGLEPRTPRFSASRHPAATAAERLQIGGLNATVSRRCAVGFGRFLLRLGLRGGPEVPNTCGRPPGCDVRRLRGQGGLIARLSEVLVRG
jgi:hypothetical protein